LIAGNAEIRLKRLVNDLATCNSTQIYKRKRLCRIGAKEFDEPVAANPSTRVSEILFRRLLFFYLLAPQQLSSRRNFPERRPFNLKVFFAIISLKRAKTWEKPLARQRHRFKVSCQIFQTEMEVTETVVLSLYV
jgi:hypothetical protein